MDLAVASPATVSRCGMVYMDASQVGCRPLMLSWLKTLPQALSGSPSQHLLGLYDWLVPVCLRWLRREVREVSPTLDGNLVVSLQRVISSTAAALPQTLTEDEVVKRVEGIFLFALTWTVGGSIESPNHRVAFDFMLRAAASSQLKSTESSRIVPLACP
jgi:dynein heavy chain, axonemal